ncbi:MAG TPA: RecQ family ATP-dependent DNA helicase [Ktedonobacteraceae bacterium]|nr:RecQ family ATP-dependent DNA helicase [Ktedonobacteraceae bacterium]
MSKGNKHVNVLVDEFQKDTLIQIGADYYRAKQFKEALSAYNEAVEIYPDDVQARLGKANALFELKSYKKAYHAYERVIFLDPKNILAHLRMGDILNILSPNKLILDMSMYSEAINFIQYEQSFDELWYLAIILHHPQLPAQAQFALLERLVINAPSDYQRREILPHIGNFYDGLFNANKVTSDMLSHHLNMLYNLLLYLPEGERANTLTLIAGKNDVHIAQLLIYLAPFSLSGLASLAHQVTVRWVVAPREDDLVIRFYHVLDSYNVPFEDSDWLFAQELMLEGLYIQAKPILVELVKLRLTAERLWLLATAMWHRHDSAQEQIEILYRFIVSTVLSDTSRRGEAWKHIGELSLQNDGMAAIAAFEKAAEYLGYEEPQLQAYRAGNWETIPGLWQHPDNAFPPVVVIDLENDYRPGANDAPGSRVFEIAAVRAKGQTELVRFHVKRDLVKSPEVWYLQNKTIEQEQVVFSLQSFIGSSIIVGHNLETFDAVHLRAMGLNISDNQILDTLTFARLLYPDSTHHNLALLCHKHAISFEGKQHTALADTLASANLLHALGDELVRRGPQLLEGFRAFVPFGCAFDRAIMQPRGIIVDATLSWNMDPMPTTPHVLLTKQDAIASPHILEALEQNIDALVERYDASGAYVQHLPKQQRAIVVVNARTRLERMLTLLQDEPNVYVLPDTRTLICPERLRQSIEQSHDWLIKLTLYCLYHASHNHDAQTLYPLRLPSNESSHLESILRASCCASNCCHSETCSGMLAAQEAAGKRRIVFSTHANFLQYQPSVTADVIVVDDADTLQMRFAEYLAERVTSEQIRSWSPEIFDLLNAHITNYIQERMSNPGLYERILLRNIVSAKLSQDSDDKNFLSILKEIERSREKIAVTLAHLCNQALQERKLPGDKDIHAYWLEMREARQTGDMSWSVSGLSINLQQAFHDIFWKPYTQHIVCGTAISLGGIQATFLTRFFGLPAAMPLHIDQRPSSQVYIPKEKDLRPASFLARKSWTESVGQFLSRLASLKRQSIAVSLQSTPIAHALADAFVTQQGQIGYQILSPHHNWTTAKIAERLTDPKRASMVFLSPRLRETVLDCHVDIEATGPLRFLNQQDPLVAAHLQLFDRLYPKENPFSSYLLPQALLELKTRISSPAKMHIILDSGLRSKVYRDEVTALFKQDSMVPGLSGMSDVADKSIQEFSNVLNNTLEQHGISIHTNVDDKMLQLALQTFWGTDKFRETPLNQKAIVQNTLDLKDQLVIASTGGGKSLCFRLPAILMAQDILPKVTLVISPLIALMKDQVEDLQNKGVFSAIMWNSQIPYAQKQNYLNGIKQGWYSIIYIAPEQIHYPALRKALDLREIGLIAIDEAHCVSEWGHNFRTEYISLKRWIETQLCGGSSRTFPILALTATARNGHEDSDTGASERGTVQDIIENLGLRLKSPKVEMPSPERPELKFSVEQITVACPTCHYPLSDGGRVRCPSCGKWTLIEKTKKRDDIKPAKIEKLVALLKEDGDQGLHQRWNRPYKQRQRGLIYCARTDTTEALAKLLQNHSQLVGLHAEAYHGKMSGEKDALDTIYRKFTSDDADGVDIVVATKAFGMGIDVRRLGFVIHFDIPETLEAYMQEAGRAGRDAEFQQGRESALCILFYHELDIENRRFLQSKSRLDGQRIVDVYEALHKCTVRGEREIYITEAEIQRLTGIKEEDKNTINPLLFYLERYTRANGRPVIERGENVTTEWLLAFEHGYEQRIQNPNISSFSRELIAKFQTAEFCLREHDVRMIDGEKLAEVMGWELKVLHDEVKNLLKRNILVNANRWSIHWSENKSDAFELITSIKKDIINMLQSVPKQSLLDGQRLSVDLENLYYEKKLSAISSRNFTRFLSALSKSEAGYLSLKKMGTYLLKFDRKLSGLYEIQLVKTERFGGTSINLFQQLLQVIQSYAPETQSDNWQVLDMLAEKIDYVQRSQLEQCLLLLKGLDLLSLEQPRPKDTAMCIIFKQDNLSGDQLDIDLSRLRLVEQYNQRKLELMREYATMPADQRQPMVNAYFAGATPLLTPFEINPILKEQQRKIVTISGGYHLITGPAGSGKTTILEEHVRYLIEGKFVPPDHILTVTHYRSAVERISSHTKIYQNNGKSIVPKTLNSVGERIFHNNRTLLQRPDRQPFFAVDTKLRVLQWDATEEYSLIQEVMKLMWQEQAEDLSPYKNWFRQEEKAVKERLESLQRLRQYGVFLACPDNKTLCDILKFDLDNIKTAILIHKIYCRYLLLTGERGMYTYDDQILFALVILQTHPDIARKNRWSYEHIIVDEFQDLTPAQRELLEILSRRHRNLLVFGDAKQDIRIKQDGRGYKEWPSSLEKRFAQICGVKGSTLDLEINFRSVQEILNVAGFIRNDGNGNTQHADKGFLGEKPGVIRVKDFAGNDEFMLRAMVGAALRHRAMLPMKDRGSVALIVALANWSQTVQDELIKRGEPFYVMESDGKYQSQHIKRVLAYFRLIEDSTQDAEVKHILRSCKIDEQQIWRLEEMTQKCENSLFDIIQDDEMLQMVGVTPEQKEALQQHLFLIQTFHSESRFADLWQAIRELETGPFTDEITEEQQKELNSIQSKFRKNTVAEGMADICSHISFVEEGRANQQLVVTSIDNAKSQAFDTVFLLGVQALKINSSSSRSRLYVSVSRARQRLFFIAKELSDENQGSNTLLSWLPEDLYEVLS